MITAIDKAKALAQLMHRGQTDKQGKPYFGHVERVASSRKLKIYMDIQVAYLHDIIEDTAVTADDLLALGFDADVVACVQTLTRMDDEKYFDYIGRVAKNDVCTRVKLADLDDNMDPSRGPIPDSLLSRYQKAQKILSGV